MRVVVAGASGAGKRWSPAYKKEIEQSRVLTTRAVVDAIRAAQRKPRVLINASAVGYYGGRGDEILDESAAPGADFLANVSRQWEAEAQRAPVRSVQVRTGIVLSARGRALHRPSWAPVPAAPLRILLGEFASALLEGQRAVPKKLLDSGFRFRFEN